MGYCGAFFAAGSGWNWKLYEFSFIGIIMPIAPFGNFETKECTGQRVITGQKNQNQRVILFRRQYI